ncbi:MAG: peptidase MA family metallohydrolase [Chloroflexota bacterium]
MRAVNLLLAFLLVLSWWGVKPAQAQAGVDMELAASVQFGEGITFIARLKAPLPIQGASLFIHDTLQGITYSQPVTFDANGVSEFRFDVRQSALRPFTTLLWRYDLTLADGSVIQSPTGSVRYDDTRFAWQTLESGTLRIHWYNAGDSFGLAALNAAQAGLQKIGGFFAPDLSQPIDIYLYASESDLRGALPGAEAWAVGHADSGAGVITVTMEAGADQNVQLEQRIPHELMHVLLARQIGAGYRSLPAWLREGMAALAEVYPNPDYDRVLLDAAARDALIPMRDLCASFSPQLDSAFLAYAQSRSFVTYLHGQFGADGLLTLARAYAGGVTCERGPERAFGVTFVKLERDWRVNALGQESLVSTLETFLPYLVLLCVVVLFPLLGILSTLRKKGTAHGRST